MTAAVPVPFAVGQHQAVVLPFALADQAVDVLAALADPATTCADLDGLRAEAGAVADQIVAADTREREASRC